MPQPPLAPLVSPQWLKQHLTDKRLRVVDLRWYLQGKDGREEYAKGHLPGAVFVDLHHDLTAPNGPGRHPVPSPAQLAEAMESAGISDATQVVVYDDAGGSIAARLWFLLELYGHKGQAHVLDGGLQAWEGAGFPVTTEVPQPPRGRFTPGAMRRSLLDKHAVERLRGKKGILLLDARAPERYRGDVEPVDARPGHIPGARNAAWADNLLAGRFKPRSDLRRHYQALGLGPADEVIVYCGSGVTACHDLLALQLAGIPSRRVHLYEGSWSDWARDPFRPAATGEEPTPRARRKAQVGK
jgi:thiosulfate/3-mercaptopyruvate sulfurtransferase